MSLFELTEETLLRVGVVGSVLDRIFCLTSSVVKGAPVLRIALDEPVDSVEALESELADLVDFLFPVSEDLRVAAAAVAVLLAAVFRCVCCREVTDSSSVSSALETA